MTSSCLKDTALAQLLKHSPYTLSCHILCSSMESVLILTVELLALS